VHLEGDTDAWRRRVVIIPYSEPKPERPIVDLADQILQREASGVLNWMLEGLKKLRADDWLLHLTSAQQAAVDNLLLESDGMTLFVGEALQRDEDSPLTAHDCFSAYVEFCNQRGWRALTRKQFGNEIGDAVTRQYGLTVRHDVKPGGGGKAQRGWVGLCVRNSQGPDGSDIDV
jgi:phage/plasmid-associated DNA primase